MPTCGAQHPEGEGRCIKPESGHADHYDGTRGWTDPEIAERMRIVREQGARREGGKAGTRRHLVQIAAGGARGVREFRGGGGPPPAAEERWSRETWVPYAKGVLFDFLRQHPGEFTTAEDVWPLLDAPQEMRAMVLVVRAGLKEKAMHEVRAKRLRGEYRTKDGVVFAENKLVPVYQSLICTGSLPGSVT